MAIKIEGLKHTYSQGTPFEHLALDGVDLELEEGKITALIGQTGSGKSTLVQHLNGLLLPQEGTIDIAGYHLEPKTKVKNIKNLRKEVGLVFQFPESQLFEESVGKDIAFGPKNFGTPEDKAMEMAKEILPSVGLDESYLERSPFELSGGQKRRVAIGGILVQDPSVLVLDEPTAGLDPAGATEILDTFKELNNKGKTVLLVSHDMEQVLSYADNVVVMDHGKPVIKTTVKEFFSHPEYMESMNIEPPGIVKLRKKLQEKGFNIPDDVLDEDQLIEIVSEQIC